MQPHEPATGPVSEAPPPGPPRPAKLRNRRARLIVAMIGGLAALLCLGGVGVVISLYDEATEIKRTAPDAAVDNFLRAYLVNRDDQEASLYQCKSGGDFAEIAAFRADIASRESQFSIGIRVTWTSLAVSNENGQTKVATDLRRAITDGSERTTDRWSFVVVDQDGWRVCSATQVS